MPEQTTKHAATPPERPADASERAEATVAASTPSAAAGGPAARVDAASRKLTIAGLGVVFVARSGDGFRATVALGSDAAAAEASAGSSAGDRVDFRVEGGAVVVTDASRAGARGAEFWRQRLQSRLRLRA